VEEDVKRQCSVIFDNGKTTELRLLGTNWSTCWNTYNNEYKKKNIPAALFRTNGFFYTASGKKNNWGQYYEAYEAISKWVQ
jgi:hypothetical protein